MMTAPVLRRETFGAFTMDVMDDGVALILFDRPPVNAVSIDVYEAIGAITDRVAASDDIRAMVLAAPPGARLSGPSRAAL